MRQETSRKRKFWGRLLILLTLSYFFVQLPFYILNTITFQKWFIHTYRPFAPWKIDLDQLVTDPWNFTILIKNLKLEHPKGHTIEMERIEAKVRPLRFFFRGQVALDPFTIKTPRITVVQPVKKQKDEEDKEPFKLRTALLLRSLMIDNGKIEEAVLTTYNDKQWYIHAIDISLKPSFLGGSKLELNVADMAFQKNLRLRQLYQNIDIEIGTNLNNWSKTFPYIDDVKGEIIFKEARVERFYFDEVATKFDYHGKLLRVEDFAVKMGNKSLLGSFSADFKKEKFSLDVDTPDTIPLPELGPEWRTFNFGGVLKTKVHLEGSGLSFQKSKGTGKIDLTHTLKDYPQYPTDANVEFNWQNGTAYIQKALLTTDGSNLQVTGQVGLKPFDLHLGLLAKDFEIQRFFERFRDKNLHPIFGKSSLQGTIEGIDKTFRLKLAGEAIDGGYATVHAQKAVVNLDLDYNQMKLDGKILTDGKETGQALFIVKYGAKLPIGMRSKMATLDASFNGQPLLTTLPNLVITGLADATLKLSGPTSNISGKGTFTATQGVFIGQSYDKITSQFTLTSKQLVVHQADITLLEGTYPFIAPLRLDFQPGGFRMYGKPLKGFEIDAIYHSKEKLWDIHRGILQDAADPTAIAKFSGTYSATAMNLRGVGRTDLANIKFITRQAREASGIADMDITLRGSYDDMQAFGYLTFDNNLLALRIIPFAAEELTGTLKFSGNRIQTENLEGLLGTGAFKLKGSLQYAQGKATFYDLHLTGEDLYFRNIDGYFRMEYDADVDFKGPATGPTLSGSLTILDGRYTKDFNIIEEIKTAPQAPIEIRRAVIETAPVHLNLDVRTLGDFTIDNNVGRIELATFVKVRGTEFAPQIDGNIEVQEGKIRYLGLDLDITRGFMEFRDPIRYPYLEVAAEKEFGDVNIRARLHGYTNNLNIDLAGNSASGVALEKRDVLSLIFFGMTIQEREERAAGQQFNVGPQIAYGQFSYIIQRPLERWTTFDIFRLESIPTQEGVFQRFYLGKRFSDRFIVELASDINREDAVQTLRLEYWLTDFLIFKAARSSDEKYQLNLGVRFKGR